MLRHLTRRPLHTVTLAATLMILNGCLGESPVGPDPDTSAAPTLPSAERLSFDFGFFQEPSSIDRASRQNFFNAYVRAAVVNAVAHVVLVPPVAAFSVALHTPPTPQADGSWLWIYTWSDGTDEAQIRLRGTSLGAHRTAWELRVSSTIDGYDDELWFAGETWDEGDFGEWRFHDPDREGKPQVASLYWGEDSDGEYLRFEDDFDNVGDSLEFRENGADHSFTYTDADDAHLSWYVRWDAIVGSGSLRAPDYNGGEPACWDEHQIDTVCPVS